MRGEIIPRVQALRLFRLRFFGSGFGLGGLFRLRSFRSSLGLLGAAAAGRLLGFLLGGSEGGFVEVDQLHHDDGSGVTLAETEVEDTGVSTGTVSDLGSDGAEELGRGVFVLQVAEDNAAGVGGVILGLGKLKPAYTKSNGYRYYSEDSILSYTQERKTKKDLHVIGYARVSSKKQSDDLDMQTYEIPNNAKYVVYVKERKEFLRPIWCVFNGFWWWNFNASITEKKTGNEIMSWRGRGCQNSSIRKLNAILDELEK